MEFQFWEEQDIKNKEVQKTGIPEEEVEESE